MVQSARALERYRASRGGPPDSLDALVPSYLPAAVTDPWGRPLVYERSPKGYRLACLGSDGAPGGEGDSGDLIVVNGSFVTAPR